MLPAIEKNKTNPPCTLLVRTVVGITHLSITLSFTISPHAGAVEVTPDGCSLQPRRHSKSPSLVFFSLLALTRPDTHGLYTYKNPQQVGF
jgi:hypothetical protein